jgi:hypothetical protein
MHVDKAGESRFRPMPVSGIAGIYTDTRPRFRLTMEPAPACLRFSGYGNLHVNSSQLPPESEQKHEEQN